MNVNVLKLPQRECYGVAASSTNKYLPSSAGGAWMSTALHITIHIGGQSLKIKFYCHILYLEEYFFLLIVVFYLIGFLIGCKFIFNKCNCFPHFQIGKKKDQ